MDFDVNFETEYPDNNDGTPNIYPYELDPISLISALDIEGFVVKSSIINTTEFVLPVLFTVLLLL